MCRLVILSVWFVLLVTGTGTLAKSPVEPVRKGNAAYNSRDYKTALEQYSIAET